MTKKPSTTNTPDAALVKQEQPKRAPITKEFKLDAVKQMRAGASPTALALKLGVRRNQLHKWDLALRLSGALPVVKKELAAAPDLAKENARLRRELAAALEEAAILKKLGAYLTQLKR